MAFISGHGNRSIPARAGEPSLQRLIDRGLAVYPRACGGTLVRSYSVVILQGLSPRVLSPPILKCAKSPKWS